MRALLVPLALAGCAAAPPAPPVAAAPSAPPICTVWDRELAFAKSVADHDAAKFAEHVHPAAVFVDGSGTFLRGRDAVVEGWRGIIEGKKIALMWHPTVVISDAPGVALSRGPYLIEDPRPDAKNRFLTGTFQSVWVKEADGAWRVWLDGGTPPPVPAMPDEAAKLKAELHAPCRP